MTQAPNEASDLIIEGKALQMSRMVWWLALAFAVFHVWTAGFGALPNLVQRSVHVCGAIVLCMLIYGARGRYKDGEGPGPFAWAAIAVACITPIWIWWSYSRFMLGIMGPSDIDMVLAGLLILILLESSRRVIGIPFVIIVVAFLLYALYGNWLPGPLGSAGLSLVTVIESLYMKTDGLWGTTTAVTANVVGVYIVMGEVLLVTGGGMIFIELANRITGRSIGGPAKVSVIASSMFGMLSGAPAANASVTGNFTIPLMKRRGYTPEMAAAVEAVASSGSQIMPPVMGAAAFIMAEFLGMSYLSIIGAALVPAIIFYATVFFGVHLHGQREGIAGSAEKMPRIDFKWLWTVLSSFVFPVTVLLVILLQGATASKGAFWAIVVAIVVFMAGDLSPKGLRVRGGKVLNGLANGGRSLILIALLAGAAQIVVGLIGLTGFGVKLSSIIISASGGNFFFALVLSALVAMVLGMGMPTTAVYILSASVVAPALIQFGVIPLAAHLFLFYFGLVAALTPPVCVAVFVTAGIAQADWLRTSWEAMKLGVAKFVVPFLFVYHYELLLIGRPLDIAFAIATALLGTYSLSAATTGWLRGRLSWVEIVIALVVGILLLVPSLWAAAGGLAGFAGLWFYRRSRAPALQQVRVHE